MNPDFQEQSRVRLELGCPVDGSELLSMTGPERHFAAGPVDTVQRSAKAAATLLQLVRRTSPVPAWVAGVVDSESTRALLAEDVDDAGDIAETWLRGIQDIQSAGT